MKISKKILISSLLAVFLLTGCFSAFKPERIVKHPDSPMLINRIKGKYVHVSIYDKIENRLVEFGWVRMDSLPGWTLNKFDWNAYIEAKD